MSTDTNNPVLMFSTQIHEETLRIKFEFYWEEFPYVWLRDNCQCEKCFHPVSKTRRIWYKNFHIDVSPKYASISENKKILNITWDDSHSSSYDSTWLQERSFRSENNESYLNSVYMSKRLTWNASNFDSIFKKFDYNDILHQDDHLRHWIRTLGSHGIALITGASLDHDSCKLLADRIEFSKKTHYGEEFFVTEKPVAATNQAYLSGSLQPHTDVPYYEQSAGVILLHCVTQAIQGGGDSFVADGLYIANYLKKNNNKHYKILSETFVNWEAFGEERGKKFHAFYRSPIICENAEGEITRINFSISQRGSHFNLPVEHVKPWYESMKHFYDLIYEKSATYKMAPGEILCLDNTRLLHGRNAYTDVAKSPRYIIGVYMDWDYLNSRYRMLTDKKFHNDFNQ